MHEIARTGLAGTRGACSNASQKLYFGFAGWSGSDRLSSLEKAPHLTAVARIGAPEAYRLAYKRWESGLSRAGAKKCVLQTETRLFIGMSEPGIFETNITLHLPYGVPIIPGSACKGLARRIAGLVEGTLPEDGLQILFGDTGTTGRGYVDFHDAWWVPCRKAPLVREVVTPHHKEFLDSRGKKAATPFDSPEPIPQIAAQGCFLFAVEGPASWAQLALQLLCLGLKHEGIGARTPEYGTFN